MKIAAVFVSSLAVASAFAPAQNGRVSTELAADKTPFFQRVFGMDLFAPVATQNDYGARNKKGLGLAKISSKSYVPAGLTAAEYQKIRDKDEDKKNKFYQKNVAKAGKFIDYTDFYMKRGTDTSDAWFKSPTNGHRMAKTKYDFSGAKQEDKNYDGSL